MYIVISQDLTLKKETIPTNSYICAYYNKYKNTSNAFEESPTPLYCLVALSWI